MTVEQLKQYRSICAEIEEKNMELNESISRDTVRGSDAEFPYIQHTIEIAGVIDNKRIVNRLSVLKKSKENIEKYIDSIEDSLTRRIFEYRYLKGKVMLSWQAVAFKIGGGNTADSARMLHNRYLHKK